jgi:UDP-N-acetylmuramoyl-tripeptide--D-alanyl-D-alanine ligase
MKNSILKFVYYVLAILARKVIATHKPFVVGITGSVGKSSTKEAIYQVMSDKFGDQVRKNFGNLNAEIGIPLTILGYDKLPNKFMWPCFLIQAYFRSLEKNYPKYLVLEMGVEHPGDIEYFGTIVKLDIGVITSTAPVHLANFPDHEALKDEKRNLSKIIKNGGSLIINIDDEGLKKLRNEENALTYSVDNTNAMFRAHNLVTSKEGTEFRIETVGQKITIKSKMLGRQTVYANLAAFVVGQCFEVQSLKIKSSLEKLVPVIGRMNLLQGKNGILIIDDTYNASPAAVLAALDVLANFSEKRRKVFVMGNMNELGSLDARAHLDVAEYAKGKCDLALFGGPNSVKMAETFGKNAVAFSDRFDLISNLDKYLLSQDLVLVKASQNNNYYEEVVKELLRNPADAQNILVRQSAFWLKKKNLKKR